MAALEDSLEQYTHLPLRLDPATKVLSSTSSDAQLTTLLANINDLHTQFKALDTPNHAPAAPLPVKPHRTAQLQKLRESAANAAKKSDFPAAIRLLDLAIQMAADRPPWEPAGLVREELALTYMERANAYLLNREYVEGFKDAETSTEMKRGRQQTPQGVVPGNPRAFTIAAKCLYEMGRYEDLVEWLVKALEVEGEDGPEGREMRRMLDEAKEVVAKRESQ